METAKRNRAKLSLSLSFSPSLLHAQPNFHNPNRALNPPTSLSHSTETVRKKKSNTGKKNTGMHIL